MVSEDDDGEESEEEPIPKPPRHTFRGVTITGGEPYLFGVCCAAFGIDPTYTVGLMFIIDGDGLTLIVNGGERDCMPWRKPSKG